MKKKREKISREKIKNPGSRAAKKLIITIFLFLELVQLWACIAYIAIYFCRARPALMRHLNVYTY